MSRLTITRALPNPSGKDRTALHQVTNQQINGEWVEFANTSGGRLGLEGLSLDHYTFDNGCSKTGEDWATTFRGVLAAGYAMWVHTGAGLEFYLEALDRDVKKPHEQPSIGVLLCATKNHEVVEYALSRTVSPALVAEYQTRLPDKAVLQAKLHKFYELAREQSAPLALESLEPVAEKQPRKGRKP